MRMEELSENRYIKGTDTVEKYLLEVVRDFFKQKDFQPPETSREYIIEKAIERMKEELSFKNIGVLSIELPDGTVKTGNVSLTLEELNGEPAIPIKNSAFNASFGNEAGTVCEGDDPRLFDKRTPTEHQHEIEDIIGLQGIISTLQGKYDRLLETTHSHSNASVLDKITYSGKGETIDLTILDTFETTFQNALNSVENKIATYKQQFETNVTNVDNKITNTLNEVNRLKEHATDTNQNCLTQSKNYTDTELSNLNTTLQAKIGQLVTRDYLTPIQQVANNTYTLVGSMEFPFTAAIHHMPGRKHYGEKILISDVILEELNKRSQSISNCQIECFIEYHNSDIGKTVRMVLPYITVINGSFDGSLQVNTIYSDNAILVTLDTQSEQIASELLSSKIIYNVYSIQPVTL